MKYFISQPMNGRSEEEILQKRATVAAAIKAKHPDAEIIDSYVKGIPNGFNPVWMLGNAVQELSKADVAVFCAGWSCARGCVVERVICERYGIRAAEEYEFTK